MSSMTTDELLNLFRLDGAPAAADIGDETMPRAKRRRRKAGDAENGEDLWSIEELNQTTSQYENEHSVQNFMGRAQF